MSVTMDTTFVCLNIARFSSKFKKIYLALMQIILNSPSQRVDCAIACRVFLAMNPPDNLVMLCKYFHVYGP